MTDTNEPIKNIEQAKRYFISMGCSHFHLSRENIQRADEYRALKISSKLESEWIKEEFEYRIENFNSLDPKEFGWSISSLAHMIEREEFYLEKLFELINKIQMLLPPDQIGNVLSTIIGTNGTKSRGGLIQKSYQMKRHDLANKFLAQTKLLLKMAEDNSITLTFIRGYLVDVIDSLGIEESKEFLIQLRDKDYSENFKYFKEGAEGGNKYSMKMLSDYYFEGKGCQVNIEKAKIWELKSNN